MSAERIPVLLMAYGGPNNLAEVEPYLLDVRGGRPTKPELVEEIRGRYAKIGGRSPIREVTEAQAVGLGRALGVQFLTYVGMRHWHPYIKETVDRIVRERLRRLVGIVMAPHYSAMSIGAYETKLLEGTGGRLEVAMVQRWGDHPAFLDAVAARVRQALAASPSQSASRSCSPLTASPSGSWRTAIPIPMSCVRARPRLPNGLASRRGASLSKAQARLRSRGSVPRRDR